MAASGSIRRRRSIELLPPHMSEASLVLLGNSWPEKSSVGNLILGKTGFNSREEPNSSVKVQRMIEKKKLVVINTPDLLNSRLPKEKIKEQVEQCLRLCTSVPDLLLLVVQPENFTEEQKKMFYKVLELFGTQSFDCALVLVSATRQKYPSLNQALQDLIRSCRENSFIYRDKERNELLGKISDFLVKRNEKHEIHYHPGITKTREAPPASGDFPGPGQGLRIMLFGTTQAVKTQLCNFILEKKSFYQAKPVEKGLWKGNSVTVVTTPETQKGKVLKDDLKSCVRLCPPGPNVLLLLVNPLDFTEKDRQTLKATLSLFREDAFNHSVVVVTQEGTETGFTLKSLIRECEGRQYNMAENNHQKLMMKIDDIVKKEKSTFLTIKQDGAATKSNHTLPSVNLVLFGSRGEEKTSAAKAILGQTDLYSASNQSECVRKQGEVCGRWVSVVELPALDGKTQQEVMEESFRCISLCDPEGVHAFILVLPVGPLTDEDKGELQTIQDAFSSRVNDFTMILFTVESDPTAPDVVKRLQQDRDIQELIQTFGERHVAVKSTDRKQFSSVIDYVEKMRKKCYTSGTLLEAYMDKMVREKTITRLQTQLTGQRVFSGEKDKQHYERLRIVLIGKTGCGKSSSANTILGRNQFDAKASQKSVTKHCQKALSEVDGRPVAVVDTPGLFDDSFTHEEVHKELLECLTLLSPGPHVFLVVISLAGRLTPEEKETLKLIKDSFGKNAEKFTIILLTRADEILGKQSIADYIENECDETFKKLIRDCGGRYHVLDNINMKNRRQVTELIRKIDIMFYENGCFTNEMLEEAETAIQREIQRNLKEKEKDIKRQKKELEIRHQQERDEFERKLKEEKAKNEQEIKEKNDKIKKIQKQLQVAKEERMKEQEQRKAEEAKWKRERSALLSAYESEPLYEEVCHHTYEQIGKSSEQEALEREMEALRNKWAQDDKKRQMEEESLYNYLETITNDFTRKIEEDELRKEMEDKYRHEMDDMFRKKLEEISERYENEARQKAEELNEFKKKYMEEFAAQKLEQDKYIRYNMLEALKELRTKHRSEIIDLVKHVTRKRDNRKKIKDMLSKHEEQMKNIKTPSEMKKMCDNQDSEIGDLIQQLLKESDAKCCIS